MTDDIWDSMDDDKQEEFLKNLKESLVIIGK